MSKDDYLNIVLSAADDPAHLRAGDVYRVLDEAKNLGLNVKEFGEWLRLQPLMERTRFSLRIAMEGK
jgi:hypothetical protein